MRFMVHCSQESYLKSRRLKTITVSHGQSCFKFSSFHFFIIKETTALHMEDHKKDGV